MSLVPSSSNTGMVDLTMNVVERPPGGFSAGGGLSGSRWGGRGEGSKRQVERLGDSSGWVGERAKGGGRIEEWVGGRIRRAEGGGGAAGGVEGSGGKGRAAVPACIHPFLSSLPPVLAAAFPEELSLASLAGTSSLHIACFNPFLAPPSSPPLGSALISVHASALISVHASALISVHASALISVHASALTSVHASALISVHASALISVHASALISVHASALISVHASALISVHASALISVHASALISVHASALISVHASALISVHASALISVHASALISVHASALISVHASALISVHASALISMHASALISVHASALISVHASALISVHASALISVHASALISVHASALISVHASALTSVHASALISVHASALISVHASALISVHASALISVHASALISVHASALISVHASALISVHASALISVHASALISVHASALISVHASARHSSHMGSLLLPALCPSLQSPCGLYLQLTPPLLPRPSLQLLLLAPQGEGAQPEAQRGGGATQRLPACPHIIPLPPSPLFTPIHTLLSSFTYSHRNVRGRNQKLNVAVERGQLDSIFRASYSDPWIEGDDKRTSRAINIQNSRTPDMMVHGVRRDGSAGGPWAGGVTIARVVASVDYSRPIRPRWTATAGLNLQRAGARDDHGHPKLVDAYGSPLTFSGRASDDMLIAKLETVYTDSGDNASSQVRLLTGPFAYLSSSTLQLPIPYLCTFSPPILLRQPITPPHTRSRASFEPPSALPPLRWHLLVLSREQATPSSSTCQYPISTHKSPHPLPPQPLSPRSPALAEHGAAHPHRQLAYTPLSPPPPPPCSPIPPPLTACAEHGAAHPHCPLARNHSPLPPPVPSLPSLISRPLSPVPCLLSLVSCPLSPVPCLLSLVSCPLSPVPCLLSLVSCPLSPVPYLRPLSPVPCLLSLVSCPLSPVPCLLSLVSCPLSPVPCLLSLVSCPLSPVPCLLSLVSCPLSPVPCLLSLISRPLSPVPCLLSLVSCPLSPVPCLLSLVSCPLSPVPCLLSLLVLSTEQAIPIAPDWLFFNRINARARNGFRIAHARLIGSFSGGTVVGDLAPHEAFPIGGTNSVRGYDEGAVGSGRSYIVTSGEISFPMFGPLEGAFFADYGTDLGSGATVLGTAMVLQGHVASLGFGLDIGLAHSVFFICDPAGARGKPGRGFGLGAGVRVDSPLGPLRLEYAFNDQKIPRFHFGIGYRN
ncbi:unnamed protein product [Closterium sp. NIES-65]|nr:unnamed protein product [Closterium sp. NIES-65]